MLGNGVVVLAKRTRMTPAVTIHLGMRAGTVGDPASAPGATWLLSRVLDRGTTSRSSADIAEALDSRGVTLEIGVSRHLLSVVCTCLAEDFDPLLSILADVVVAPACPEDELVRRRREVVTAIRQDDDNPAVRATEGLMALLYPDGHPYGQPMKGAADVVERLTRGQLLGLHADRFAPSQLTAVVVGDLDVAHACDAVDRALGAWRRPVPADIALPPVVPASGRRRVVVPMMNKAQVDIAYGFTAIRRADPAHEAFRLMNNVLGQYALGGRLGDSIRERQGMAYYVSSALDANVLEGPLTIRAGVSPDNVDRAVSSIDDELAHLSANGVTAKELDDSRRYLVGAMPLALETNAAIAAFLQMVEFHSLGLDYDLRLPDLLRAVTLDEVNAAARAVLDPSRATVVIAGPYQT